MLTVVILLGVLNAALVLVLVYFMRARSAPEASLLLKQDITDLSRGVSELKESLHEKIGAKLDKSQQHMSESIQRQFSQSAKIISEITQRLTKLDETNQRVIGVTDELKTLQNVLLNPKQRGGFGEYQLRSLLENCLPPSHFVLQYAFKDNEVADAVILLDKGRLLAIDSKFSMENYNRIVEARDKETRARLVKIFKNDLKARIDETAKYIRPRENTLDYAFMFIPSEAIYYDLLVNKIGETQTNARDLIEYAYRDKRVIIVSPTTFMAYLQTVLQGLRSLQIEEQAKDIQKRVGELGRHLNSYEAYMKKMGVSLGTTVNHYNTAYKELGKIDKDVVRIAETTPVVEALLVDGPQQLDE